MRQLSCAEARDLASDLIDGSLDQWAVTAVEAHVAGCATCPNLYLALVAVHAELSRQRDLEPGGSGPAEAEGPPGPPPGR